MTNEQLLDDLKQFIGSRISQAEARFDDKLITLDSKLEAVKQDIKRLEQKVDDGFSGVAATIEDTINHRIDYLEDRMDAAEAQLKKLRHLAA